MEVDEKLVQSPVEQAVQDTMALILHFKDLGNQSFRAAGTDRVLLGQALHFYMEAAELQPPDQLLSVLYGNMAAVFLRMEDFQRATSSCKEALDLDAGNEKALFRGAKASQGLGLLVRAARFCDRALKLSPENKELRQLQQDIVEEYEAKGDPEYENGLDLWDILSVASQGGCSRAEAVAALRKSNNEVGEATMQLTS